MVTAFAMIGTIAAAGCVLALLDWLARRHERQSKHRRTA
jgi:hypothetical protein